MKKFLYEDLYKQENTHWWHIAKRSLVISLVKKLPLTMNSRTLDIGCGTGRNVEELGKYSKSWGIDSSKLAIKYCKTKGLKQVRLGKANRTGFNNSYFNLVTLLDVLEHTEDAVVTKEIRRILAHKGYLILTVPAYQWLWSKWDEILHHKRRYSKNSIMQLMEQHGFKIVHLSYIYSFLLPVAIIVRKLKPLFLKQNYTSDFDLSNKLLNKLGIILSNIERVLLGSKTPFGTSIVCIAINEK